jgi:hypothetical protein
MLGLEETLGAGIVIAICLPAHDLKYNRTELVRGGSEFLATILSAAVGMENKSFPVSNQAINR